MDVVRWGTIIRRWGWLVILSTALAAGISYRAAAKVPPVYRTTTTLLVGRSLQTESPSPSDIQVSQALSKDYALQARSQPVLQATVDALGLKEPWYVLSTQVSSLSFPDNEQVQITVADEDPRRARLIADEIARQLILQSPTPKAGDPQRQFANQQMQQLQTEIKDTQAQIADLQKRADQETSALALQDLRNQINFLQQKVGNWQGTYAKLSDFYQGSRTNYLSVVQPAVVPTTPVGTKLLYNVALAGGVGFVLAVGGVIVAEVLDDSIKSPADAEALGLTLLGGLRHVSRVKQPADSLVATNHPHSTQAEEYRYLSSRVCHPTLTNGPTVLLVTSPAPLEGKSTVAANLAVTIAATGKMVILVDANLHRPSIHRMFGLTNAEGLSTLLRDDRATADGVLRATTVPSLRVLPSGPLLPNPGDILSSRTMADRLSQIRELADVVIVDTAAILGAAETGILAAQADEIILVARAERTRRAVARQAIQAIAQLGLRIHGIVLNGRSLSRGAYQRYYRVSAEASTVAGTYCPKLGLRTDATSVVLGPSPDHRCHASSPAQKVTLEQQVSVCLCNEYKRCPRLVQVVDGVDPVASRSSKAVRPPGLGARGANDLA